MPQTRRYIGLSGFARAGKTSAGQALAKRYQATVKAFAQWLRFLLCQLELPLIGSPEYTFKGAVSEFGYDECKAKFADFRPMMQRMGERMRAIDPDFWINIVLEREGRGASARQLTDEQIKEILLFVSPLCNPELNIAIFRKVFFYLSFVDENEDNSPYFVVEDVRTPREAERIRQKSGIIIGIDRPGIVAPNQDEAESIPKIKRDYTLQNDGSLEELEERICRLVHFHCWESAVN